MANDTKIIIDYRPYSGSTLRNLDKRPRSFRSYLDRTLIKMLKTGRARKLRSVDRLERLTRRLHRR